MERSKGPIVGPGSGTRFGAAPTEAGLRADDGDDCFFFFALATARTRGFFVFGPASGSPGVAAAAGFRLRLGAAAAAATFGAATFLATLGATGDFFVLGAALGLDVVDAARGTAAAAEGGGGDGGGGSFF